MAVCDLEYCHSIVYIKTLGNAPLENLLWLARYYH